ncbi:spore germination lipoprotein GerD [Lederbergia citrea]|uniref:spore germination lipoprotein GerD n=1 Tax=Lederbergia citrea TaxID=2833581 RepID=UPI001BC955A7|nr:spore germination lipoprotein GerD [Lederbergia citrea]MBS4206281.1 spore gernimation protein GerD [Lederbergia citrea]
MRKGVYLLLIMFIFILSSCSNRESGNAKLDYDQTKKMMVDLLKTDEGKKAIQDIMTEKEMKEQLVMDQAIVKETIEKTLTSDKGQEFWKKAFKDPKFAAAVAKSMKKEDEALLKGLMKDPEYQGMVMDILKDPQVQKDFTQALKSKEFREHLQQVVTDTMESPIFKAKIQDILLKAAEETKGGKQGGKSGESQGGGGGGGGAGGGSSS